MESFDKDMTLISYYFFSVVSFTLDITDQYSLFRLVHHSLSALLSISNHPFTVTADLAKEGAGVSSCLPFLLHSDRSSHPQEHISQFGEVRRAQTSDLQMNKRVF